jgi:hypothetical protein
MLTPSIINIIYLLAIYLVSLTNKKLNLKLEKIWKFIL